MSLTEWAISLLGKSYGIERMGREGRGKDTALLNPAFFCSFFFNVGEFQIPERSSLGPVLRSAKVRFHFSHPPSAPEAPSLQEDISVQPQAQPEQSTHKTIFCPAQLEARRKRDVMCCPLL